MDFTEQHSGIPISQAAQQLEPKVVSLVFAVCLFHSVKPCMFTSDFSNAGFLEPIFVRLPL